MAITMHAVASQNATLVEYILHTSRAAQHTALSSCLHPHWAMAAVKATVPYLPAWPAADSVVVAVSPLLFPARPKCFQCQTHLGSTLDMTVAFISPTLPVCISTIVDKSACLVQEAA
jgi:hypothetical protein